MVSQGLYIQYQPLVYLLTTWLSPHNQVGNQLIKAHKAQYKKVKLFFVFFDLEKAKEGGF